MLAGITRFIINAMVFRGGNMEKIYIIEDEPFVAEHLAIYLRNRGHKVLGSAATAASAISEMEELRPSMVFVDIVIAGDMDGIEAAKIIRDRFDIPIIFLTSYRDDEFFERAKELPPCAYLLKPFNERELDLTVEMAACHFEMKSRMQMALKAAEEASMAKSDFISHLNHELRAPLQSILGFSDLLQANKQTPLDSEQQESVEEIINAGQYMDTLIGNVLDLSRIESNGSNANMEPINLEEIIPECLSLVKPLAKTCDVHIVNELKGGLLCNVMADVTRLKEAIINLLTNAIKYNRPAGRVTLECAAVATDKIRLTVTDTGIGISEQDLARLFQPFVRLRGSESHAKGTGLGLVITKRLVELMGGEIGYEANPEGGSCFWISLQRAPAE